MDTQTNTQTAQTFLDIAADLNNNVDATDISIAHQLPSRDKNRSIIVIFTKRNKKLKSSKTNVN